MTDTQLRFALDRLAPHVDDRPAWDDVVRRAGAGPRFRWRLVAVVAAMIVGVGLVAGALAGGLVSGSLDHLSAWMGDQPGEPAPEEQAAFNRENAASYAHFPTGTRVGRLVHVAFGERGFSLVGFRDGPNLCVRVVPSPFAESVSVPECAPQRELTRLGEPVAVIGGHIRTQLPDGSGLTMLYGLAADDVESIDVLEGGDLLGPASVENNAFLIAVHDRPGSPVEGPPIILRARDTKGGSADFLVRTGPMFPTEHAGDLPGPVHVDRTLTDGSIGWLDRGEARGQPFAWPSEYPQRILHSRMLAPDPTSSFRLGLASAEGTNWQTEGRWYCLAWLWPLAPASFSSMCTRADAVAAGLSISGAWPTAGQQFPLWVGMAADEVARIELFYRDGTTQPVPVSDNVFAFYTPRLEPVKLVAYDHEGRVVKIDVVGGLDGRHSIGIGR